MSFFTDLGGWFFGPKKREADYSAELDKFEKDVAELKRLMVRWEELPKKEKYQQKIAVLKNPEYHVLAKLVVVNVIYWESFDHFITNLKLAVNGDENSIAYVENTRKETEFLINRAIARFERIIEEPEDIINWADVKVKVLEEIESQQNIFDVFAFHEGDNENKLRLFVVERSKNFLNHKLSQPARLVWAMEKGRPYSDKYFELLDQIIAADKEARVELVKKFEQLKQDIDYFLTQELLRIRAKYPSILSGQGGI